MTFKRLTYLALPLVAALAVAGCGSSDGGASDSATTVAASATTAAGAATTAAAAASTGLKGVCPDKVIVQTDWFPEAEHGATYDLMGDDAKSSKDAAAVTGTLTFQGKAQGVQLEIRAGGPALGGQTVVSQLYKDTTILFGYVSTDEAIKYGKDTPTVAVVAPQDKSPQIILWDRKAHPNVKTIAEIAKAVDKVTVFAGGTYTDYLVNAGIIPKDKIDLNYNGDKILAKPGADKVAHQGFATAEPYQYATLDTGAIEVGYQLVYDTGWELYPEALAVRADALKDDKTKACLKKLVPMFQQAQVDYVKNHARADKIIIDAVKTYDTFWKYDQGAADESVKKQVELGIIGNGKTATLGDMEDARLTAFIAKALPVFEALKVDVKKDTKPSDIATNEFLDKSITWKP